MVTCGYCGKEVPQQIGKREKLHCNNVHRQLAYRKRKQGSSAGSTTESHPEASVQEQTYISMLADLLALQATVVDQTRAIDELEKECSHLRTLLDVEKRYLADNTPRGFKTWLKKQEQTDFTKKLLADPHLSPRDTRAHYEYRLKLQHATSEELEEFTRLWKRLLLSQA